MTFQGLQTSSPQELASVADILQIIGAPSFFPTVWGWIKRWFDPITVSKIFILSNSNMKATLEQYIEPENIPKKYGGKLDYQFGALPVLDPAIQNSLRWHPESASSSQKSFPTGPIRWHETANGEMEAIAVGSVDGKPRNERVAVLDLGERHEAKPPLLDVPVKADKDGATNDSTPSEIYRTTTGDHTHPPSNKAMDTDLDAEQAPPAYPAETGDVGQGDKPQVPDTSRRGTYTVPVRAQEGVTSPLSPSGEDVTPTDRQGTSEIRFEQQNSTHAAGTLAEGTPEVRDHGHGDKTTVMEPKTVGQAPKEVPRPEAEDKEGGQDGYVTKLQAAASNAYQGAGKMVGDAQEAVKSAVGLSPADAEKKSGEKKSGEKKSGKTPVSTAEPATDGLEETHVEEYLRSTVDSKTPPASAK